METKNICDCSAINYDIINENTNILVDFGGTLRKISLIDLFNDMLLNKEHPIGSYYMSEDSTDPSILFGGTWEQIKDTFLLAAGDIYAAGETGGEAEVELAASQLPAHTHHVYNVNEQGNMTVGDGYGCEFTTYAPFKTYGAYLNMTATGSNEPHNNMPPYTTVYMWKRIA
jgi:hypothetical protein